MGNYTSAVRPIPYPQFLENPTGSGVNAKHFKGLETIGRNPDLRTGLARITFGVGGSILESYC
jgi:hypothetical protein